MGCAFMMTLSSFILYTILIMICNSFKFPNNILFKKDVSHILVRRKQYDILY